MHGLLIDIPPETMELPEGFQVGSIGVSGNTGMRRRLYGPCPPTGAHHYHFVTRSMSRRSAFAGATLTSKALAEHKPLRWPDDWAFIRNKPMSEYEV